MELCANLECLPSESGVTRTVFFYEPSSYLSTFANLLAPVHAIFQVSSNVYVS